MSQTYKSPIKYSWFIIVNPIAGNRNFSKQWRKIQQLLNNKKISFSFAFTQFSKHEIKLVDIAIQQGFRNIISIGGDGTLHHVVNGIMLQRYVKTSDISIAVIPLGTGNDWIKTYRIPNNLEKAVEIIHKKKTIFQDIGVLETENNAISYFNNVAGLGYDGYIVNRLKSLKKLGKLSYLLAGIYGLFFYKKGIFEIIFNNKKLEENCLMIVFGICKFSGGGMQFTENVAISNGLLDITILKNFTFFDLIFNLHKLYTAKIFQHKKIETFKTKQITVIPKKSNTFIQADGEIIGTGKVTVKIIKKGIRFVIK